MKYKDIVDFIFNKKEDEELFALEDAELERLKDKSVITYNDIIELIDKKVHPKCREKLKNLLLKYENQECAYLRKQNELLYRNGVADSV